MTDTKTAEEHIWLQSHDEDGDWYGGDGPTWCVDKINDTDIEYIRADVAKSNAAEAREGLLREVMDAITGALTREERKEVLTPLVLRTLKLGLPEELKIIKNALEKSSN